MRVKHRTVRLRRKLFLAAVTQSMRLQDGELFADVVVDRREPRVCHCVVQRKDSPEILFLGQFPSQAEAETAAKEFMSDHVKRERKSSKQPKSKAA